MSLQVCDERSRLPVLHLRRPSMTLEKRKVKESNSQVALARFSRPLRRHGATFLNTAVSSTCGT